MNKPETRKEKRMGEDPMPTGKNNMTEMFASKIIKKNMWSGEVQRDIYENRTFLFSPIS